MSSSALIFAKQPKVWCLQVKYGLSVTVRRGHVFIEADLFLFNHDVFSFGNDMTAPPPISG